MAGLKAGGGGYGVGDAAGRLVRRLELFAARAGYQTDGSIPEGMTFRAWCEDLAAKGLKVDRKPFRLDDRPALVPIYDAIPTTRAQAAGWTLVIQKATQLGLTVWEVLAQIYMAKKFGPVNIGMFLPDQATAGFKSEHRFMPILRSAPELHRELTHRVNDDGTIDRIGEGNILTRAYGTSLMMFLWTSGRVSTESRPMDIVSLDEVQEMTLAQIDKVLARMGDSDMRFALLLSTANMPDLDINFWYQLGTQEVWHTRCDRCGAESDLSDPAGIFPAKSIIYTTGQITGAPVNEYVWGCPACGGWIKDPQQGRYIAACPDPGRQVRSFLLPRTISPRQTPRMMMEGWGRSKTGDQRKSFYNRTLARPYIDADQLPVTMAHCMAGVEEGRKAGVRWLNAAKGTVMGIDQMGGWNAHIIKQRLPDGRQAVIHVEATFGLDPFARSAELMKQYGVSCCVVEQLPNVNDARRFANAFPGRVFLAGYATDSKSDMLSWGDQITRSDRKTAEEDRDRFRVTLQQYKAMQTALFRVRDQFCLFPPPEDLEQDVIADGVTRRIPILHDWVFDHFTKTALVVETNEETRALRPKVLKVGIDPHFSFANMLCDAAWARDHGTGSFWMPEKAGPGPKAQDIAKSMPGLPEHVARMMDTLPGGVCGRCSAYEGGDAPRGQCSARDLVVGARDPQCPLFDRREDS